MFCSKCGKQVSDLDKFCSQCGSADPANADWLNEVQNRMRDPEFRKRVEEQAKYDLKVQDDFEYPEEMDDPEYQKAVEEEQIFLNAVGIELDRLRKADDTKKKQRNKWNESEVSQLMKEYESGWSTEKMADAHERTLNDVIQKLFTVLLYPELPRRLEAWSDEEDKAFKLEYSSGLPLKEIAKKHGRSVLAIAIYANKLGVNPREIIERNKKERAQ